jgi:hypothetical protein
MSAPKRFRARRLVDGSELPPPLVEVVLSSECDRWVAEYVFDGAKREATLRAQLEEVHAANRSFDATLLAAEKERDTGYEVTRKLGIENAALRAELATAKAREQDLVDLLGELAKQSREGRE